MAKEVKHFSDEDFDDGVSQGVVLVDFYADWCGPCKMLAPIIQELADEMGDVVTVAKVDTEQAVETATKYEVSSIPTLILFKEGEPVKKVVGLKDLDGLKKLVNEAI